MKTERSAPGWMSQHPGIEKEFRQAAKGLATANKIFLSQYVNYEFREEAEQVIKTARKLEAKVAHLSRKALLQSQNSDCKERILSRVPRGAFEENSRKDISDVSAGMDNYRLGRVLFGLTQYMEQLIEESSKEISNNKHEYKRKAVARIIEILIAANIPPNNASASLYEETIHWVFDVACVSPPGIEIIREVKSHYK